MLLKLLRNPLESPEEAKFRKIKLTNKTIARVLANTGVRDVLEACGFAGTEGSEFLELPVGVGDSLLDSAVEGVGGAQGMLQELHWLHAARAAVPELGATPWQAEGAAKMLVQTCLNTLHAAPSAASGGGFGGGGGGMTGVWVERLFHILSAPEVMRE